jgi:hypothetical protein
LATRATTRDEGDNANKAARKVRQAQLRAQLFEHGRLLFRLVERRLQRARQRDVAIDGFGERGEPCVNGVDLTRGHSHVEHGSGIALGGFAYRTCR